MFIFHLQMGALQQQLTNRYRYRARDIAIASGKSGADDSSSVKPASINARTSRNMHSSIIILALSSLLLLPALEASPVFVDNPSLAQCK